MMRWWTSLLDFFSPRTCVMCGRRLTSDQKFLCVSCLFRLPRIPYEATPFSPVAERFAGRAEIVRAAGYLLYRRQTPVTKILFRLKYHHCPEIGVYMGEMMGQDLLPTGFFQGIDCLVPVPLARRKQRKRGYNQCERLAAGLSRATGLPVDTTGLVRRKANPTQTRLGRLDRWDNVQGLFQVTSSATFQGKHLLLIDDVITTGATLLACIEALREVKDIHISVLALAVTEH